MGTGANCVITEQTLKGWLILHTVICCEYIQIFLQGGFQLLRHIIISVMPHLPNALLVQLFSYYNQDIKKK